MTVEEQVAKERSDAEWRLQHASAAWRTARQAERTARVARDDAIRGALGQGMSLREVAAVVGIAYTVVRDVQKKGEG